MVFTALNMKIAVLCDVAPCMLWGSCHWSYWKFCCESNSCVGLCVTTNFGVSPYFVQHHKTAQTRCGRIFNYWLIFALTVSKQQVPSDGIIMTSGSTRCTIAKW